MGSAEKGGLHFQVGGRIDSRREMNGGAIEAIGNRGRLKERMSNSVTLN
tara:strand:- start:460 stop:606 length:147 start_codon:yes stop_codon:yes gene_type:complete